MSLTKSKGKMNEDANNNARVVLFQEKLKKQLEERHARNSRLICGIWGEPKTVKSGLALDFPNKQIYVLDWDDGCEPTWRQNHEMTDRITLWNLLPFLKEPLILITKLFFWKMSRRPFVLNNKIWIETSNI